jgi:hypothetical protein
MPSREQYLDTLREEYRRASKQLKKRLLNEARKARYGTGRAVAISITGEVNLAKLFRTGVKPALKAPWPET